MMSFTAFAEACVDQIDVLKRSNTCLRHTRDLLLLKLISGELDVSDLDIAVPEEVA